jgi:hypothetical protein
LVSVGPRSVGIGVVTLSTGSWFRVNCTKNMLQHSKKDTQLRMNYGIANPIA